MKIQSLLIGFLFTLQYFIADTPKALNAIYHDFSSSCVTLLKEACESIGELDKYSSYMNFYNNIIHESDTTHYMDSVHIREIKTDQLFSDFPGLKETIIERIEYLNNNSLTYRGNKIIMLNLYFDPKTNIFNILIKLEYYGVPASFWGYSAADYGDLSYFVIKDKIILFGYYYLNSHKNVKEYPITGNVVELLVEWPTIDDRHYWWYEFKDGKIELQETNVH